MASPPSSPSESSPLAFSYDRGLDGVDYPHGHDQSQPQTPASTSTTGLINYYPQSNGQAKTYSPSSLAAPPLSYQSKHMVVGREEECEIGTVDRKQGRVSEDIDPFSKGELAVMSGSSLMVLGLIIVALMMILGKIALLGRVLGINEHQVSCWRSFSQTLGEYMLSKEESRDEVQYRGMICSPGNLWEHEADTRQVASTSLARALVPKSPEKWHDDLGSIDVGSLTKLLKAYFVKAHRSSDE
ncbi:hypothetical protein JB92DRAFT_2835636 [Gautieria morchelliformis]|nr:hypothetical protein JB92DRAFT_2835636 [Gautieria morchelliformis]